MAESGLIPIEPQFVLDEVGLKCNVFAINGRRDAVAQEETRQGLR